MPSLEQLLAPSAARQALLALLLGTLAALCLVVLRPFVVPAVWAAILAYTTWPAYQRVYRLCRGRASIAAAVMTGLVAVMLVVPVALLASLLQDELAAAYRALGTLQGSGGAQLPEFLRTIPWLGDALQQAIDRYAGDPLELRKLVVQWAQGSRDELLAVVGTVGRNVAKLVIAIVTVFFFFRDGALLVDQARRILSRMFQSRLDRYIVAASAMIRAVVFGFVVTAIAQGTIAGIGYAVVGVTGAVLLGALTAFASIVPVVGTGIVWGAVAASLLMGGHFWPGLGLLAWGAVLVHPVDNLLRPMLISNATRVPFLLVMFGVLGGIAAFGFVGLFIGPATLAVATAVWREWLEEGRDARGRSGSGPSPPA